MEHYYELLAIAYFQNDKKLAKCLKNLTIQNHMTLKDIVDAGTKAIGKITDGARLTKAMMYYADGERYRLFNDDNTYKYFKRRVIKEYEKIKDPKIIETFKENMRSYLPKKYLN